MPLDLIVIGCGPAGYKAAAGAARLGAAVAIVESGTPGGNCLNEGCIPTRALLHPAMLIEDCNALTGRGLVGSPRADFAAAVRHKDAVVAALRDGLPGAMRRLGIRMLRGAARFEAPGKVRVGDGETLEAPRVVVATGSRPRVLAECPFDGKVVLSSREFFSTLNRLPDSVLCVGGGAVGVEAAYLARQYGARVTLVEREPRLLPAARVPEHVADLLEARLERLGVELRTGARVAACRVQGERAHVTFDDGSAADYGLVLVAVGREPNSSGLGLEQIGVRLSEAGQLRTDALLETDAPGVYAAGDVRDGPMTANAALYDAKLVVANALGGERLRANYFKVPVRGQLGARDRHRRSVGSAGRGRRLRPARRAQQLRRLGQGARAARLRRLHRGGARPRDRPAAGRLHRRLGSRRADPAAGRRLPVCARHVVPQGPELQPPLVVRGDRGRDRSPRRVPGARRREPVPPGHPRRGLKRLRLLGNRREPEDGV